MDLEEELPALLNAAGTGLNPPIDALVTGSLAHGRRAVRRRTATVLGCALATCATVAAGVAWLGVPTPHQTSAIPAGTGTAARPGTGTHAPSPGTASTRTLQIDTAAWSVHTEPDDTIQVTIRKPTAQTDPLGQQLVRLREVLAGAGIPVYIDGMGLNPGTKPWCTSGPAPAWMPRIRNDNGDESVITVDPSAIPPGTALRLIVFVVHTDAAVDPVTGLQPVTVFVGVKTGRTLACIVPADPVG